MIGALITFDNDGRVKEIHLVGMQDTEVAIAEYGLRRLVQPRLLGWLTTLFRRVR